MWFLPVEGNSDAKIHNRLFIMHEENIKSNDSMQERCLKFQEGWTDIHDEGITDDDEFME